MSDPRDAILARIRRSLGVCGEENERRLAVQRRLHGHPAHLVPERARAEGDARLALFRTRLEAEGATIAIAGEAAEIPALIADHLTSHNLPSRVATGRDPFIEALPWDGVPALQRECGTISPDMSAAFSKAIAAAAETGTLALASGPDNPTSLNFLPDTHIVAIEAEHVLGSYEEIWNRLREIYGHRSLPRTINLISGPSRTADIEQTIIMGAHGPRNLHVIVVA